MKSIQAGRPALAIAAFALLVGCSQWQTMDQTSGAVAGAASGAVAGALIGGPVGAVIGGVGGAYAGYGTTGYPSSTTTSETSQTTSQTTGQATNQATAQTTSAATTTAATSGGYTSPTVRAVQQALNDRGYNAGPVDGHWGATTQEAVKRFQRASGLPDTGELAPSTLSALGVS